METHNPLLVIISLLFFYSAEAKCVPRNFTHHIPVSSPPPKSLPPPHHVSFPLPISPPPPHHVSDPPKPPPHSQPAASPPLVSTTPSEPAPSNPISPSPSPLSFPPVSIVDPAVKKICGITDYPALCISAVAPFLIGKVGVDPAAVLGMIIKACSQKSQIALAMATRIAKDPTMPPRTASNIDACKDSYSDAMDNLQSAADAMLTRDTGTLNSMLSAAMTDFGTCEEGFAETPGVFSPMADWDDMLSKLASNCLAVATLIK